MYRGWGGAASRVAPLERAGKDVSTGVRSRIESRGINVDCLAPVRFCVPDNSWLVRS